MQSAVRVCAVSSYYLYCVGAKKFVSVSGNYTALSESPAETIIFFDGERTSQFPWVVVLNNTAGEKQIGVSNSFSLTPGQQQALTLYFDSAVLFEITSADETYPLRRTASSP